MTTEPVTPIESQTRRGGPVHISEIIEEMKADGFLPWLVGSGADQNGTTAPHTATLTTFPLINPSHRRRGREKDTRNEKRGAGGHPISPGQDHTQRSPPRRSYP